MNNFSINYDFNPSDTRAMDEFRKDNLKEQKMEVSKDFTPMLVLVPNKELDFFTKMLQKFNFKIDNSDKEMSVVASDDIFVSLKNTKMSEDEEIEKILSFAGSQSGSFKNMTVQEMRRNKALKL